MAGTKKQKDYCFKTEQIRTQISERDDVTTIYFHLKNLDVKTLSHVYPTEMGEQISKAFDQILVPKNATVNYEAYYQSHVVADHKLISEFNNLAAELKAKLSEAKESNSVLNKQYRNKALSIGDTISKDVRDKFIKCLNVNDITFKTLEPHIDTLFFVCLYFYNEYWDTYGIDFNGDIAKHQISNILPSSQPFEYRAASQVKYLTSLLYDYLKQPGRFDAMSISSSLTSHKTNDPIIIEWLINSILQNSLPASTGNLGKLLSMLIKSHKDYRKEEFLTELKKFTKLRLPKMHNTKRKVVCQYCWEIHLIFSHYLGLEAERADGKRIFDGQRLYIYNEILKCFGMEDFDDPKRKYQSTASNKRRDSATNRLGALLRSK